MELSKRAAISYGLLLVGAMLCGVFSSVTAIEKADYLARLVFVEPRVLIGVAFQALMAITYVAIVVITYPLIKAYSESGALAYVVFRATGAAFLFVGIVTLLLLMSLGRRYAQVENVDLAYFELIGTLLRQGRDWLNHIGMILPWSVGGLFLYWAFLTTRLIPLWLSVWGLIGTALTLVATVLYMLDQIQLVTVAYFALNMPTALFELTLAVYLMVQGLRAPGR